MFYFKSKIIQLEHTTKRFQGNEAMVVYSYGELNGYEYVGVQTEYAPEDVIALQAPECEVEEIQYSEFADIAINSAIAKGIDDIVRSRITAKFDKDEELKLVNLGIEDKENKEYLSYRACVCEYKEWGKNKKREMGVLP